MCNGCSAFAHAKNRYDDVLFKCTNIMNYAQSFYPVFVPLSAKVYSMSIIHNNRDYYQLGIINAYKQVI